MSEMTLSEAMRLGAMLKRQGFASLLAPNPDESCALRAAADAVGIPTPADLMVDYLAMRKRFSILNSAARCHLDGCEGYGVDTLGDLVWHLNDVHRWTREQIADWVETIERRAEAEGQPQTETPAPAVRRVPQ